MATGTGLKVVLTAIGGNFLVTVAKFVGWFFTASPSMLAEGVHSAADTANQCLILVGIKQSEKKADTFFPWGHGKARYVWNLISAMGIFFIGFGFTTYHGVHSLLTLNQHHFDENNLKISIVILLFSLVVEGYALLVAWQETRRQMGSMPFKEFLSVSDDPTTLGVLFEDFVAVLGVLVAFVCVLSAHIFHIAWADSVGSILIGCLMGLMAIYLARLNGRLLIGSSSSLNKKKAYQDYVESFSIVERVINLHSVVIGSDQVILNIDLKMNEESLVDKDLVTQAIQAIKNGEEPGPILVKHSSRMVRVVGAKMIDLEHKIRDKYPEVSAVALELH